MIPAYRFMSLAIAGLLLLTASPASAQALPGLKFEESSDDNTECNNYGVINMITVLGTNTYCPDAECTNEGVILFVGPTNSCHGDGLVVVCVGSTCQTVGENSIEAQGDACGVATQPACWVERTACPTVREARSGIFPPGPPQATGPSVPAALPPVLSSATLQDLVYALTACECHPGDERCDDSEDWSVILA